MNPHFDLVFSATPEDAPVITAEYGDRMVIHMTVFKSLLTHKGKLVYQTYDTDGLMGVAGHAVEQGYWHLGFTTSSSWCFQQAPGRRLGEKSLWVGKIDRVDFYVLAPTFLWIKLKLT
jgi:hypothetical protein